MILAAAPFEFLSVKTSIAVPSSSFPNSPRSTPAFLLICASAGPHKVASAKLASIPATPITPKSGQPLPRIMPSPPKTGPHPLRVSAASIAPSPRPPFHRAPLPPAPFILPLFDRVVLAFLSVATENRVCSLPFLSQLDNLRVVLVNPRNPLNIGAAARAMSNFGFFHLRVVNPYELAFREARSAVGASPLLARAEEFKTLADAIEDCTLVVGTTAVGRRQPQHLVKRLEQAAPLIRKRLSGSRVALLFGSEKRGLSNEDLSHCQWLLRIPTREDHRSMNLGQAVAVCLYELARDPHAAPPPGKRTAATAAELERITSALLDALLASGYVKSPPAASQKRRTAAPTDEKIRRLVRRLHLSSSDADLLLGILRQILWKSRSTNDSAD